ncbi:MAG: CRISPR-associated helicase Cas3' [Endomicrobium sp.]|jgi:CRISPR-associated endonuclease/helicase Cas3|nr:CRISPR-associated helicase Cas3' [Endomicrobium sp.]
MKKNINKEVNYKKYYSRFSEKASKKKQFLRDHLCSVAKIASQNAEKIGLKNTGFSTGLLHDFGKYSSEFQKYLDDKSRGIKRKKGEIDHSTAGAKFFEKCIRQLFPDNEASKNFAAELVELCCISHHSGLIDMLDEDGENIFEKRLNKEIPKFEENIEEKIKREFLTIDIKGVLSEIAIIKNAIENSKKSKTGKYFAFGMLARFLLSCLIDADHTNSADFELELKTARRKNNKYKNWSKLLKKLNRHINNLNKTNISSNNVKQSRQQISEACAKAGKTYKRGCYKLEVPTGGGKTLASLRFAFEMANRHHADRIIYSIPFTTIIEQNAKTIRDIVEDERNKGAIVLEHHSNLSFRERKADEEEIDRNEILTQNWDAPIVFTTNVQVLETLFGGKTSNIRRMHQLANSIIIFDEVQSIPIKCIHIFNNAINFLVDHCKATVVLCTATQPLLDKVCFEKGAIMLSEHENIIDNTDNLFDELNRVDVIDKRKSDNWKNDEIAQEAIRLADENENCLVVCNLTKSAKEIFQIIERQKIENINIYHLSAKMCPAHRKIILNAILKDLEKQRNKETDKKIILISTQVIEAGVDIDFNCGIRALAGFDSIAQTAGRINRNGNLKNKEGKNIKGKLFICNFVEDTDKLEHIKQGKISSLRVFDENKNSENLLTRTLMDTFYKYYFYNNSFNMIYPVKETETSILDMLTENQLSINMYMDKNFDKDPDIKLRQGFAEAAKNFDIIDAPTSAVIVPYGEGNKIIDELYKANDNYDFIKIRKLLKKAQLYSVNIYPNELSEYRIHKISDKLEILCLDNCYYSENFGITNKPTINQGGERL